MNRQGRYQTLSRLARGAVFSLSNAPADTNSWKVLRHRADGLTEVERLHEDRTLKRQFPRSTLMVFVPAPEPVDYEAELEALGLGELEDEDAGSWDVDDPRWGDGWHFDANGHWTNDEED